MSPEASKQQLNEQLLRNEGYLQVDPGNTELLARVIDLSLEAGDMARAQQHVDAACQRYPNDPFFQYRRAHVLVAQGKFDEAAPVFAALLETNADANIAFSLADCQMRAGDYAGALQTMEPYRDAADLSPEAATLLVRALHHTHDFATADALITAHRERLATEPAFLAAASLLYLDDSRTELATELSEAALACGRRPVEALITSGTLALGHTDTATAIERYNEVLAMNPKEGRSWSGLGMANLLKRDLPAAAAQLEQAVHWMPTHIGTWHALGWCRIFTGDLAGAGQAFKTALDLDRNFGESHGGMAVVLALSKQNTAAEEAIERAVRLDPKGLSARYAQMILGGQAADPERFKAIAFRFMGGHKTLSGEDLASAVKRHLD